eukprot:CAMPEP_0196213340 /NCGR_PEP_ID=MMETSP0912-20130531/24288_1 /TAXON_ID=49265 /ORGANISM="Thalassiosira rotula, Strain GSO102" /LENGTH=32 /DNA_ID= /DNA_START= /DNA_END= /DNA_ORIENTATION=
MVIDDCELLAANAYNDADLISRPAAREDDEIM